MQLSGATAESHKSWVVIAGTPVLMARKTEHSRRVSSGLNAIWDSILLLYVGLYLGSAGLNPEQTQGAKWIFLSQSILSSLVTDIKSSNFNSTEKRNNICLNEIFLYALDQ